MTRPIRILQVVSKLGARGGVVEVRLAQVMRRIGRKRFQVDFPVHGEDGGAFEPELR